MRKPTTKKRRVTNNYVDNQKLLEAIVAYRKELAEAKKKGLDEPRMPEYIGECIYKIASNLANMPRFMRYSFREEMIGDGYVNCILYFKSYDPDKKDKATGRVYANPFAYFTQVAYFAFVRRINEEEELRYSVYKNFQETISSQHDTSLLTDEDGNCVVSTTMYDNINEFMHRFEKKKAEKKLKRRQAKESLSALFDEEEENIEERKDNEQ